MIIKLTTWLTTGCRRDSTRQRNRTSYTESYHLTILSTSPIQHERLKKVCTSLNVEQIETSFAKTERTDLARFHSGHHPALRHWQQLVGISEDAVCRLCGEEVEASEHLWLRCPAILVERHHSDLGHLMDVLFRFPRAAVALRRITPGACGNIYSNNNMCKKTTLRKASLSCLVEFMYYLKQVFHLLCDNSVTPAEALPYFSCIVG